MEQLSFRVCPVGTGRLNCLAVRRADRQLDRHTDRECVQTKRLPCVETDVE